MALDMTQLNEKVERFNKEYGVNFNASSHDVDLLRYLVDFSGKEEVLS